MLHAPPNASLFGEPTGQGWRQVIELAIAFGLSTLIGLERELRQKSAGLRTHTLVGLGAALFVLVSKYGFTDVLAPGRVVLDPSRVAAQIVSGIGFVGAGLIFVRRDAVRGLTTAAVIWLTAAVGAACGAGLPILAAVVTAGHFLVVVGYSPLARRFPRSRQAVSGLDIRYEDGRGLLRRILAVVTNRGFTVVELTSLPGRDQQEAQPREAQVTLLIQGHGAVNDVVTEVSELDGVFHVRGADVNELSD